MSFKNNETQAEAHAGNVKTHVYLVEDDGDHKFWRAIAFVGSEIVSEFEDYATDRKTGALDAAKQFAEQIAFERRDPFIKWLNTLLDEKGINLDQILEIESADGLHLLPLSYVITCIKQTTKAEQMAIKAMLVKIDFYNGDLVAYFKHLAQALVKG